MRFNKYIYTTILPFWAIALYSMDQKQSIKQQIDEATAQYSQTIKTLREQYGPVLCIPSDTLQGFAQSYQHALAGIVLRAEGLMPDLERLSYLQGDCFYGERKKIICHMIEKQQVNPNDILYDGDTPLFEAAVFKDKVFIEYLLSKGAQPDVKTTGMMKNNFLDLR